jgi:nitroreductase
MELMQAIKERRSIRRFTEETVDESDLLEILDAARWAPNAGHQQLWQLVVIKNKEIIQKMVRAVTAQYDFLSEKLGLTNELTGNKSNAVLFGGAPVTIAVFMKPYESKTNEVLKQLGCTELEIQRLRGQSDLQSVAAAIQNLLLAAHAKGYGTCWMCAPLLASREIEKILAIKEPWQLKALIPIGKPLIKPHSSTRKELEEITTFI